jgi:hypothetical protein
MRSTLHVTLQPLTLTQYVCYAVLGLVLAVLALAAPTPASAHDSLTLSHAALTRHSSMPAAVVTSAR